MLEAKDGRAADPTIPARPALTPARLAFFYAAFYTAMGVFLPFWPVWLAGKGLDASDIGIVLAVGWAMRLATTIPVGQIADRRGERRPIMIVLAAGALVTYAFYGVSEGMMAILVVTVLFSIFWNPIAPMSETLTVQVARAEGFEYGRVRLWGSITFILVAVGAGRLLKDHGSDILFAAGLGAVALTLLAAVLLPGHKAPAVNDSRFPLAPVLRDRRFLLFLGTTSCVHASHAVYYGFSTLHWRSVGHSDTIIGSLWAEGVIAEIILFGASALLVRRIGPERLIALAGAASVVRWTALASTDSLPVLVAVQALHAFSFGAAHLGAMHFIGRAMPPALLATAQSVYSVAVVGLAVGLATAISGGLYQAWGSHAYFGMAVLAALGTALAYGLGRPR